MKHGRTTRHWWCPRKSRIQEKQRSIRHVLKKADKTWVVHQIHDFLDDEYQINKIWTDLCSHTVLNEILEHFLNPGHRVQCESRSSLAESAILKYHWSRIGHDHRPCRLNIEAVRHCVWIFSGIAQWKRKKVWKIIWLFQWSYLIVYTANILTLLVYLDVILCLKVTFTILQIKWIEPFKEGMIQSKSDVGFTSNGSC